MKKQLLFVVLLLAATITAKAQVPDTARLLVHYKFTHVGDTTNRAHPHEENMVLFIGKNASSYKSYDLIVSHQQFKKAWAEASAASPDGHPRINRMEKGSPDEYYQYPNEQKLFTTANLMINTYLIESPLPVIDWKISADTATFGGMHCQKATCHFKGRDYIAWFCPDIPVRTGPWKLNGLPGVIVDARDVKNEVIFKFDGVEKAIPTAPKTQQVAEQDLPPILRGLDDDQNLILPPSRDIKTTQKEYDKLHAAMEKDPQAFAQALNASMDNGSAPKGDHIMIKAGPGPGPGGPGHGLNNPIELPEK
jgi:GLPGLI family protein